MKLMLTKFTLRILLTLVAIGQNICLSETNSVSASRKTSQVYKDAVLKAMLDEANEYAKHIGLPENLPITRASLKETVISPPAIAIRFGALGSFRTEKFSYAFGRGRRLSYITRLTKDAGKPLYEANKHLAIPLSSVNTNSAYMMATQWLAKAFVDLQRLSQSATVSVRPWRILDMTTCKYTVEWQRGAKQIAEVTLIEPTNELLVLRVEDPELILRPPLGPSVPEDEQVRPADPPTQKK